MKTKPARRGRKSAGRPKLYDLSSLIVWTEDYRAKAEALGNGSVSAGVRAAIDAAVRLETDRP